MGRNFRSLSLKQKLEIIEAVSKKCDKKNLVKTYKCNLSTIKRIVKNKDTYLKARQYGDLRRKRERRGLHAKVEESLFEWFHQQKRLNMPLTNADILKKAKELAIKYDDDFEPCLSWLLRWRNRKGIELPKRNSVGDAHYVNEISVDSSCSMVQICKAEHNCDEGIVCYADSTNKQSNQLADVPVDDVQLATTQVSTNNTVKVSCEEPNVPSISGALQALLVVKQFFILNDMEISSLFSIEEKILQRWKKSI